EALVRCVKEVAQSNEADNLLGEISREYAGRAAGAKALGRLAADQLHREEGDCRAPSPFYRDLLDQYGKTREAARVIISRASRCLGKREHEREALADLEGVADAQKGNPEGALALWMIGNYYRDQEDRDRAAIYYHRAIDEYPETLEYPYHPGLKV